MSIPHSLRFHLAAFLRLRGSRRRSTAPMRVHTSMVSRITAAIIGGYALAALTSVAALALPLSVSEAVLTGMLLSFPVYAGAVVWVFAARSASRAWLGLLIAAAALLAAAGAVWWRSAA